MLGNWYFTKAISGSYCTNLNKKILVQPLRKNNNICVQSSTQFVHIDVEKRIFNYIFEHIIQKYQFESFCSTSKLNSIKTFIYNFLNYCKLENTKSLMDNLHGATEDEKFCSWTNIDWIFQLAGQTSTNLPSIYILSS